MTEGEIRKFIEITCGLGQDMYEAMRERGEPFQCYMTAQGNDGRSWLRGYLFEPPRGMTSDEKAEEIERRVREELADGSDLVGVVVPARGATMSGPGASVDKAERQLQKGLACSVRGAFEGVYAAFAPFMEDGTVGEWMATSNRQGSIITGSPIVQEIGRYVPQQN